MTYVLLTRPEEDCQELKAKLIIPTISSPLLKVTQTIKRVSLPDGVTDLIVTSARVFEMVTNLKSMSHIPVWCVGEATATAAKNAGFETIFQVNRSAQEILERIVHECPKDTSHFAHICGSVIHVNLTDALTKLGFKADRLVIYETEAADQLTKEATKIMQAGLIQQIPFFSLRTAEVFIEVANKSDWSDHLTKITALAHSEAIARVLRQLAWKEVICVTDLSAERIVEYYNRSGDQLMKQRSLLTQFILTLCVSAITAAGIVWVWPKPRPEPLNFIAQPEYKELTQSIADLKEGIQATNLLGDKIQSISRAVDQLQQDWQSLSIAPKDAPAFFAEAPTDSDISQTHHSVASAVLIQKEDLFKNLYQQLTTGTVSAEIIDEANHFLPDSQKIPTTVRSVRDLQDQLAGLPELSREVPLSALSSNWKKAMGSIGLKVRKTETTSLKEQASHGLKSLDFSFIDSLAKESLPKDWAIWTQNCAQTAEILNVVSDQISSKQTLAAGDAQ